MDWYYVAEGQQAGPVSEEDLQALLNSGTITAETLVWNEGMDNWTAYGSVISPAPTEGETPAPTEGEGKKLSLKKREEPSSTETEPAGSAETCRECNREFPADHMIEYEGSYICAECKPAFFQRIQEGVTGTGGATPNAELMARARASLSGTWGLAIGVFLLHQAISIACQFIPVAGSFIPLLISGPLGVGLAIFFISIARSQEASVDMLFWGFKRFGTTFLAYLLMSLFILLWMLLLIIPGIIAAYAYSMTFYVLADDENAGALEAIRKSKEMMKGNKWKLFCLGLRFIGWALLCVLTLGIGFIWLGPYISTSYAHFYDDVKPN